MIVETTRFAKVSFRESDLVQFPEGIFGFSELRRFIFLDDPDDDIFIWLQSCEQPEVAFPLLEPELFVPNYTTYFGEQDLAGLHLKGSQKPQCFCIITIPETPKDMTANLKAPIVVNIKTRTAKQYVLQNSQLDIRQPIFLELQQRFMKKKVNFSKPLSNSQTPVVRLG